MKISIVIPNWNGKHRLESCLPACLDQTLACDIVVVDNGSVDGSVEFLKKNYPTVIVIEHEKNLGFAGGVNAGIRYSLKQNYDYIGLLNNDAIVDKNWAKELVKCLEKNEEVGAATCKLLGPGGKYIDSTGDQYSTWGLPIARQRDEPPEAAPDTSELVFGACAGASVYRPAMFKEVGLLDEDFFAYYEDSDLNFRMQHAGWKAMYWPAATASHAIGGTSGSIKGFTTYQTTKNLPMVFFKNVPTKLLPYTLPRFAAAYYLVLFNSLIAGRGWPAFKGHIVWLSRIPSTLKKRNIIQKQSKVSAEYISSILLHDLPPDARKLRLFRYAISLGRIKP